MRQSEQVTSSVAPLARHSWHSENINETLNRRNFDKRTSRFFSGHRVALERHLRDRICAGDCCCCHAGSVNNRASNICTNRIKRSENPERTGTGVCRWPLSESRRTACTMDAAKVNCVEGRNGVWANRACIGPCRCTDGTLVTAQLLALIAGWCRSQTVGRRTRPLNDSDPQRMSMRVLVISRLPIASNPYLIVTPVLQLSSQSHSTVALLYSFRQRRLVPGFISVKVDRSRVELVTCLSYK